MALAKRMRTRKEQLPEEMVQGGGKQMVRKEVASKPLQQGSKQEAEPGKRHALQETKGLKQTWFPAVRGSPYRR